MIDGGAGVFGGLIDSSMLALTIKAALLQQAPDVGRAAVGRNSELGAVRGVACCSLL